MNRTRSANSTGDVLQAVRDLRVLRGCVARLQPVDDRSRQRVAQQFVGSPARAIQLPLTQEHQTLVPLQAVSRRHPDDGDRDEERVGEPELADRVVHDPVAHDVVVRDHQDAHDRRVRERQAAEDVAEHEDHHQAGVRPFGGSGGDEHPMRRPQPGVEQQDERHPLAPVRREPARVRDTEADHERGDRDPVPDHEIRPLIAGDHDVRQEHEHDPQHDPQDVREPEVREAHREVRRLEVALERGIDEAQRDRPHLDRLLQEAMERAGHEPRAGSVGTASGRVHRRRHRICRSSTGRENLSR